MTTQQMETIKEQIMEVTQDELQAFPCVIPMKDTSFFIKGMTLRDWFAGQALAHPYTRDDKDDPDTVAIWAYQVADSMLAERINP